MERQIILKGERVKYKKDKAWVLTPPLLKDFEIKGRWGFNNGQHFKGAFVFEAKIEGQRRLCYVTKSQLLKQ